MTAAEREQQRIEKQLRKTNAHAAALAVKAGVPLVDARLTSVLDPNTNAIGAAGSLASVSEDGFHPVYTTGAPVGIGADGLAEPTAPEPGFFATWWPGLLGLAVALVAYFFMDWAWYWSLGAGVGTLIVINLARKFLGG